MAAAADEACALAYWRGQALLALSRRKSAYKAFAEVGRCPAHPALGDAAAAEAEQLRDWLKRKQASATAVGGASAGASRRGSALGTADSRARVLLLTFHGGVAASVRWAAEALQWSLDAPELDDSWVGGCDAAHDGGEGARVSGAQPSAGVPSGSARLSMSSERLKTSDCEATNASSPTHPRSSSPRRSSRGSRRA